MWLFGDIVDDEPAGAVNAGVVCDDDGASIGVGRDWSQPGQAVSGLASLADPICSDVQHYCPLGVWRPLGWTRRRAVSMAA